jgi:multiple sugar transport system substrate-binding protein
VWTNGAEVVSQDFRRCTLDGPRAAEALQFMQDLIYKYRVAPTPEEETAAGGAMAMFIGTGKVGMRITPVAEVSDHRRAQFRWDYAVNPVGKGKRLTTGGGVGWEIMGPTKHQEEAWAVFQHLVSAETAKRLSVVSYPGRKSALAHLLQADPELPPKSRHVGADGQRIIHPDPIFPGWDELERDVISPELQPLWRNERTARQVVEAIVPKANAFLQAQPQS